eukprot:XP_001706995.1 20S proteasome alpha subunit 7 [Giardia lamblia ATCC 50803]
MIEPANRSPGTRPARKHKLFMTAVGSGYDVSCGSYSPDGKIFQVDYALKAVEQHGLCVGIRTSGGVALAVQKNIHDILEIDSAPCFYQIEDSIVIAVAGLQPDGMVLVSKAREVAESYRENYSRIVPTGVLANSISGYMQLYTHYGEVRPFGCSLLIAGYDSIASADEPTTLKTKYSLYLLQPSGDITNCFATAAGRHTSQAKVELENHMGPAEKDTNDRFNHLKRVHNSGGLLTGMSESEAILATAKVIWACHDHINDPEFTLRFAFISDTGTVVYTKEQSTDIQEQTKLT